MAKRSPNQSKTSARKAAARLKASRLLAATEPVQVTADYHREDDGTWTTTLLVNRKTDGHVHAPGPAEALDAAVELVGLLADRYNRPVATMHTLDGDPGAWADLARELGLQNRVSGDSSAHWVPLG